jgi:rubrerythrin
MLSGKNSDNLMLINLLNQILELEHGFVDNFRGLTRSVKDEYTSALLTTLATASLKHADRVAEVLALAEEIPHPHLQKIEETSNLTELFVGQMDKETLAARLFQQCAGLVGDETLKREFSHMAEEKYMHSKMVKTVISNLRWFEHTLEPALALA